MIFVSIQNRKVRYEAANAFRELCDDITEAGLELKLISAYRSYATQEFLYNNYVEKDGVEKADLYSARPGHSEHQLGLALDFTSGKGNLQGFQYSEEFQWLEDNHYKYGFILRYPKGKEYITGYQYEPWHYRYVGLEIAEFIYNNDLTYDEYYIKYIDR